VNSSRRVISIGDESFHAEMLKRAIGMGLNFVLGRSRAGKVVQYIEPKKIAAIFNEPVPYSGTPIEQLIENDLKFITQMSVSQCDPRYIAFPDSGNAIAGQVGNVVSSMVNQNMITVDKGAPVASFVERQFIRWHRMLVGYDYANDATTESLAQLGGMVTSGGNLSNIIALAGALHRRFPQLRRRGWKDISVQPVLFVPAEVEHFSYEAAACLLGLGEDNVRYVALDDTFSIDLRDLRCHLDNLRQNEVALAVVAYAGNTRTSSVDDIAEVGRLSRTHNAWFHVDACHGGSLLFGENERKQLLGIEEANSVTIDSHKTMLCTYPLSVVLFRDGRDLARIGRTPQKAESSTTLDLGQCVPFYGSRGFEALKGWLIIKNFGQAGLAELAASRIKLASLWYDMLVKSRIFAPFHRPHMYKVAFSIYPRWVRDELASRQKSRTLAQARTILGNAIDAANQLLAERLYRSGSLCIDTFRLRDLGDVLRLGSEPRLVLGSVVANPLLDDAQLVEILADLSSAARLVSRQVCKMTRKKLSQLDHSDEFDYQGVVQEISSSSPASWGGNGG